MGHQPLMQFAVVYEAKKAGAIGWPSTYSSFVEAETVEDAKEKARWQAYADGLEHVHIMSCRRSQ
jgi:hypothetical protein